MPRPFNMLGATPWYRPKGLAILWVALSVCLQPALQFADSEATELSDSIRWYSAEADLLVQPRDFTAKWRAASSIPMRPSCGIGSYFPFSC